MERRRVAAWSQETAMWNRQYLVPPAEPQGYIHNQHVSIVHTVNLQGRYRRQAPEESVHRFKPSSKVDLLIGFSVLFRSRYIGA